MAGLMKGPTPPLSTGDITDDDDRHNNFHDDDDDDDICDSDFGNNNGTMATILMAGWNDTDARSKMFALYVAHATLQFALYVASGYNDLALYL